MVVEIIRNGVKFYVHTAWANDTAGTDFSLTEYEEALFVGNYIDRSSAESNLPVKYAWKEIHKVDDENVSATEDGLTDYEERMSDLEASARENADDLAGTQQSTDSAIGNPNLLLNTNNGTANYSTTIGYSIEELVDSIGEGTEYIKCVKVTCNTPSDSGMLFFNADSLRDVLGSAVDENTYTLSMHTRMSTLFDIELIAVQNSDGANQQLVYDVLSNASEDDDVILDDEWVFYESTTQCTEVASDAQMLCMSLANMPAGAYLIIANLKIEAGAIATPWRESVEEVSREVKVIHEKVVVTEAEVKKVSGELASFKTGEFENLKAGVAEIEKAYIKAADVETIIAGKGYITDLQTKTLLSDYAKITTLESDYVKTNQLEAKVGTFGYLKTTSLESEVGKFGYLKTDSLESEVGKFGYLKTSELEANVGNFGFLKADSADLTSLLADKVDVNLANINTAWVEDLMVKGNFVTDNVNAATGSFSKYLTGVKIIGDLIEANTLKAKVLIIEGEDGVFRRLNINALGEAVVNSDPKYNEGLDGSIIVAKSITADQINVTDLFAQTITATGTISGATLKSTHIETLSGSIGGFNIGSSYIASANTTALGTTANSVYLGLDGISLGTAFKVTAAGKMTATGAEITGTLNRTKITDNGMEIMDASGNTVAQYGPAAIYLGKNSQGSVINLNSGLAQISNSPYSTGHNKMVLASEYAMQFKANGSIYHDVYISDGTNYNDAHAHVEAWTPWTSGATITNSIPAITLVAENGKVDKSSYNHTSVNLLSTGMLLKVSTKSYSTVLKLTDLGMSLQDGLGGTEWIEFGEGGIEVENDLTVNGDSYLGYVRASEIQATTKFVGTLEGTASKAIADANGNNIVDTYATKGDISAAVGGNYLPIKGLLGSYANTANNGVTAGLYTLNNSSTTGLPATGLYGAFFQLPGDYKPQMVIGGTDGEGTIYVRRYLTGSSSWTAWARMATTADLGGYALKDHVHSGYAASSHTHTKSQITDFPTSMPASDVYAWAKASSKPSYTYSEVGAAVAGHTHSDYASSGHSHSNYLPLSGGALTGALTFANGTLNNVGDDVQIGDQNVAGTLCVRGINGTTGIRFLKYNNNAATTTIMQNDVATHGCLRVTGRKGDFNGILLGDDKTAMNVLSNEANQGLYNESTNQWSIYYNRTYGQVGILTTPQSESHYKVQIGAPTYIMGYFCASGIISEENTPLSDRYAAKNHSHSYLPLGGGTLSGDLTIGDVMIRTNGNICTGDLSAFYEDGNGAIVDSGHGSIRIGAGLYVLNSANTQLFVVDNSGNGWFKGNHIKLSGTSQNDAPLMARGTTLSSAEKTPSIEGAIAWTYK